MVDTATELHQHTTHARRRITVIYTTQSEPIGIFSLVKSLNKLDGIMAVWNIQQGLWSHSDRSTDWRGKRSSIL